MPLRLMAAIGTLAATALLLAGCAVASPPSAASSAPSSSPSRSSSSPDCPDIKAQDFAVQVETTVADPVQMAKSVGLGAVLEGTCAYGFKSTDVDGVAFFIIDPSQDAAAVFFGEAVEAGAKAGFAMGNTQVVGQSMTQSGKNADGAAFLVAYFPAVNSGDGVMPDSSMKAIGLHDGDAIILGSIQLAG
jgi:hypothetical protein